MKKFLFIVPVIMVASCYAYSNDNGSFMNDVSNLARKMLPTYRSLSTCTPAENEYFKVYGKFGDKCHFKYVNYDCYVPMSVAQQVSKNSVKGAQDAINGTFSTRAITPEAKYNESILNNRNYCKQY